MKIVHVNNVDLVGNRFNGYDLQIALNKLGIEAKQFVMEKYSSDENVISLIDQREEPFLNETIKRFKKDIDIQIMSYPYLLKLKNHPFFQNADIVHYHLLHNYFGSLPLLPELTRFKRSILTIHDPWIFTGHCIYPLTCNKWIDGCQNCLFPESPFPISTDNSNFLWSMKKRILSHTHLDIIVASPYMMKMVKSSPITQHIRNVHLIPFGVNLELFNPKIDKEKIRKKYSIPSENFVISFRADRSPYKGLPFIMDMLSGLNVPKKITVLTVGDTTAVTNMRKDFQYVNLSWLTNSSEMAEIYSACDLFLMPSTAEAFGLMAIECMASARPIIVLEGTSLPEITFAPECGISIKPDDISSFVYTVTRLINNSDECQKRGELGRVLAEKHYDFNRYVNAHLKLYEKLYINNLRGIYE